MNESEARRAALTAAVTVNATWNMEEPNAILALAERFEEWLLRPGLPGVEIREPGIDRGQRVIPAPAPGINRGEKVTPTPKVKTTPLCLVCHHTVDDHNSHGCGNGRGHLDPGWGEGVCTCPHTGLALREGRAQSYTDRRLDGAVPTPDVPEQPDNGVCACSHARWNHGYSGCLWCECKAGALGGMTP